MRASASLPLIGGRNRRLWVTPGRSYRYQQSRAKLLEEAGILFSPRESYPQTVNRRTRSYLHISTTMYDLHCHLLPQVDDGPSTWEETLALASALVTDGIHTVAATPHSFGSSMSLRHDPALLSALAEELRHRLAEATIPLTVVLGSELYLLPDLPARLQNGVALAYQDTHTVLLESPPDSLSHHLERAIFDLQLAGYRIVLAHPERTASVQKDPNSLLPLIEKGVFVQLTASSLAGLHGKRLREIAEALVAAGMCHLLATDAHAVTGRRAPTLRLAVERAAALVGSDVAQSLVTSTPAALLHGDPLNPPPPRAIIPKRRRWLW